MGLRSKGVSRITNSMAVEIGEGPNGASMGCLVDSEVSHGLLHSRGARERGCCWGTNRLPGRKRSVIIFFQTIISISNFSNYVSSTRMGSAIEMGIATTSSSTRMCSARPRNTRFVEPSLTRSKDPSLICRGLSLRASTSVNPLGRKPRR